MLTVFLQINDFALYGGIYFILRDSDGTDVHKTRVCCGVVVRV